MRSQGGEGQGIKGVGKVTVTFGGGQLRVAVG